MSVTDVPAVGLYKPLIEGQIRQLSEERGDGDYDTPILESDCAELLDGVRLIRSQNAPDNPQLHNAAIETVFRETFINIVATVDISEPAFAQIWALLDISTVLSDNELCDPGLGFWLVEELLDSQTIDGCRKVFDYLESRRERITTKHFKQKSLVILRCCNELLRRLSRAEDTVFCGRVFIFLFQSFPLGDKSSVNLRGEFHVENVTTFDPAPQKSEDAIKPMELDTETPQATSGAHTPASSSHMQDATRTAPVAKAAKEPKQQAPDLDVLYPKFWSLQTLFSSPTRLFDASNMAAFKDGISMTLSCFKSVATSSAPSTNPTDVKRGLKRKRTETDSSNTTSTFNPKYLTNRDLFDLEVHDLAFRRHILVQALIMIDFLLSLAPAAKAKFEGLTNKSVLYAYTLSDEDTKWAQATRTAIASYLQQGNGNEGKFYYRMVDTVLSRDKNWVRWKAENCPPISRDSVSPEAYIQARDTLAKIADTAKAPLPNPPGAGDLAFLSKAEPLEALKRPSKRHRVPTVEEYYREIESADLDLDFAVTEEEKKEIEERKAGKLWRALRASGRRFALCEKVQYGGNLKALVEEEDKEAEVEKPAGGHNEAEYVKQNGEEQEDDKENGAGQGREEGAKDEKDAQAQNQDQDQDQHQDEAVKIEPDTETGTGTGTGTGTEAKADVQDQEGAGQEQTAEQPGKPDDIQTEGEVGDGERKDTPGAGTAEDIEMTDAAVVESSDDKKNGGHDAQKDPGEVE